MRVFWLIMTVFLALIVGIPMAWAEKFYFYKEAGKELPKNQRYDYVNIDIGRRLDGDIVLSIALPKKYSNETDEVSLSFDFGANPKSSTDVKYWVYIDEIRLRDNKQDCPLNLNQPKNFTPDNPRYRRLTVSRSVKGTIQSKYEIDVGAADSYGEQFIANFVELPSQLFLSYKFRVRKEGGPAEVFEGTIPMELAGYNVGWWEKTRW